MSIPVIWSAQEDGRGHYNCCTQLNDAFDLYDCVHYPGLPRAPKGLDGAVYIVHGGRQLGSIDRVNMDLAELRYCVVIVLGDEENSFPVEQLQHARMKIWVQEPIPGRHDFCDRFILDGWTPDTRKMIEKIRPDILGRDLDWSFAGQVTHQRRYACVDALREIEWGGITIETKGYCQGVSIMEYYRLMLRSHIIPCPSGPFSPDSARVCEALECGCVPILDDLSPTRKEPGFWKMMFGPFHPFPVLTDWSTLPNHIRDIKSRWDVWHEHTQNFWRQYKENFTRWLREDIDELCTRT
jgi:hypothetical protein